jgi:nucleoid DNA-binding protein
MPASNIPTRSWESIIDEAAANMWVPKERARQVAAATLGNLRQMLITRSRVKIKGFGRFTVFVQKAFSYRDPRTKQWRRAPARWQYRFVLTAALDQRLKEEGPFS